MRIIGDIHGKYDQYINIAQESPDGLSVCVGDVGFDYTYLIENLDSSCHKIIPGNHDNHFDYSPHFLGRFGEATLGNHRFFFIGGAWSIDRKYRTQGKDWFYNEELSFAEMNDCLDLWEKSDCELLITHDMPFFYVNKYMRPLWSKFIQEEFSPFRGSNTNHFLEAVWNVKRASLAHWLHGHHHVDFSIELDGVKLQCLSELGYLDI